MSLRQYWHCHVDRVRPGVLGSQCIAYLGATVFPGRAWVAATYRRL